MPKCWCAKRFFYITVQIVLVEVLKWVTFWCSSMRRVRSAENIAWVSGDSCMSGFYTNSKNWFWSLKRQSRDARNTFKLRAVQLTLVSWNYAWHPFFFIMPFHTSLVFYSWEAITHKQIIHQREADCCSVLIWMPLLSLWPINVFKDILSICVCSGSACVCKNRQVWACLKEAALNNSLLILYLRLKKRIPCPA